MKQVTLDIPKELEGEVLDACIASTVTGYSLAIRIPFHEEWRKYCSADCGDHGDGAWIHITDWGDDGGENHW